MHGTTNIREITRITELDSGTIVRWFFRNMKLIDFFESFVVNTKNENYSCVKSISKAFLINGTRFFELLPKFDLDNLHL